MWLLNCGDDVIYLSSFVVGAPCEAWLSFLFFLGGGGWIVGLIEHKAAGADHHILSSLLIYLDRPSCNMTKSHWGGKSAQTEARGHLGDGLMSVCEWFIK